MTTKQAREKSVRLLKKKKTNFISEAELLKSIHAARKEYSAGKSIIANSLANLV